MEKEVRDVETQTAFPRVKAKVELEALKGEATVSGLVSQFGIR